MRVAVLSFCACVMLSASAIAETTIIGFGSCLRQWNPVPILDTVRDLSPDAFVFIGDNVYTDTGKYLFRSEPERIGKAYDELAARPEFQALKSGIPLYATWDDHDYGKNNAGEEYPWKEESRLEFMRFFEIPEKAPMRKRNGVYAVHYLDRGNHRIQLILLDTRSFRSPLQYAETTETCPERRLVATRDTSATLLGEAQWNWLARQLEEPAALRIIASSIQFIPDGHCWEKWGNFPHERMRLIKLLEDKRALRTVIISGDRHLGEISELVLEKHRRIYEITASGLNTAGAGEGELNPYRVTDDNVRVDHFGLVRLMDHNDRHVELALYDEEGRAVQRFRIDYESWLPVTP